VGKKVLSKPSADSFAVGRRQKEKRTPGNLDDTAKAKGTEGTLDPKNRLGSKVPIAGKQDPCGVGVRDPCFLLAVELWRK
jgi:hypothetical protein